MREKKMREKKMREKKRREERRQGVPVIMMVTCMSGPSIRVGTSLHSERERERVSAMRERERTRERDIVPYESERQCHERES